MINLVALPLGGILLILCPITINLALEERIKAFKDDALNKLKILNLELDKRVKERTAELEKANNLITDSIQSASAIQSAILPNIESNNYGFNELVYIWGRETSWVETSIGFNSKKIGLYLSWQIAQVTVSLGPS
jgi:hypothetical protein